MPTIFITGVSSGIGNGTAKVFAEHGWNVAGTVLSFDEETGLDKYENIKLYELNVLDYENIPKVAEQVIADFGKVDVVMNNAGIGIMGPIENAEYEQILKILKVNVVGYIMVLKAFLPHLRANKSGTIVNMGACNGEIIHPGLGYYCLSKAAIASLSEELLMELAPLGIDVKLIEPSGVKSTLGPVGTEMLRPDMVEDYKYFYDHTVARMFGIVEGNVPGHPGLHIDAIEPEQMGAVIYEAVTSGSKQFRWVSHEHTKIMFEDREKMTFQEYIDFYKDYYLNDKD